MPTSREPLHQPFFRALFWLALLVAIVMSNLPPPPLIDGADDKALHMLAFAGLAGLIALAYPRTSFFKHFVVLALAGALIEIIQGFAGSSREAEFEDWMADVVAAGAVLLALHLARQLWHRYGL